MKSPYIVSMSTEYFSPVLFIEDGESIDLDTVQFPYLHNDNGRMVSAREPKGTLIPPAPEVPELNLGTHYRGVKFERTTTGSGDYVCELTNFDFGVDSVVYEPLWATKETAQAFGMTLVPSGDSIDFRYDNMVTCQYTYGAFAGYQSPYLGGGRGRDLLAINATDLEYHNFPHVFCSQDKIPLVISVARFRENKAEIGLADLWVRPGDCLFVTPKLPNKEYVDIHGNRNSAHACWGSDQYSKIVTQTILGNNTDFTTEATKPHYHQEKHPTVHSAPPGWLAG
ncbi:MAG TPA: hypothetical protein VGQ76_04550 [Thermoanaerobaculia bacterium]|nr:hypothetical protein [Thermoanaerobaculia bacterium]